MNIAIFDLDNTLIRGDSDYLWGKFLVAQGKVDKKYHETENERYFQQYNDGKLDIDAFLKFQFQPLVEIPMTELLDLRQTFLNEEISPLVLPKALKLVAEHRAAGDELLIITSTNSFITRPIADLFNIDHLLATEPEIDAKGDFTGAVAGTPCFQSGKIVNYQRWLKENERHYEHSTFYSDSHNDLALLETVDKPIAVNPDAQLEKIAQSKNWEIMDLRTP